jgi:transcriptional regulator with XRE-family HTH domain
MDFGAALRRKRQAEGMTLEQMAEGLGVVASAVQKYEANEVRPSRARSSSSPRFV